MSRVTDSKSGKTDFSLSPETFQKFGVDTTELDTLLSLVQFNALRDIRLSQEPAVIPNYVRPLVHKLGFTQTENHTFDDVFDGLNVWTYGYNGEVEHTIKIRTVEDVEANFDAAIDRLNETLSKGAMAAVASQQCEIFRTMGNAEMLHTMLHSVNGLDKKADDTEYALYIVEVPSMGTWLARISKGDSMADVKSKVVDYYLRS